MRRIFLGYLLLALLFMACAAGFGLGALLIHDRSLEAQTRARGLVDAASPVDSAITSMVADFRIEAAGLKGTRNADTSDRRVSREQQASEIAALIENLKKYADDQQSRALTVQLSDEIQKATGAAAMSAEQSGKAIELGVDETRDLRDAIEALADSVGVAAQSAMHIGASAQQELVGMDQISDAMSSIDQAGARNAAGAGQHEEEAGHLRELAFRLEHLVSARESGRRGGGGGFDADSGAGAAHDPAV